MAKYRVETEDGAYLVETDDASQPTGNQTINKVGERNLSVSDFSPSEQRMAGRPSAIQDLIKDPTTLDRFIKHPLGTTLRTMEGAVQLMEGVPASIAVDVQNRNFPKIPQHLMDVFSGNRVPQFGDVFAGAGVPEPLAATGGLLVSMGMGGLAGKAVKAEKAVKGAVAKPFNPIKNVIKYSKPQNRMSLLDDVRNSYLKYKKDLTDIFGGEYEKVISESNIKVNLSRPVMEWFEDHGKNVLNNKDFRDALKTKDPTANRIYKIIDAITNPNSKLNLDEVSASDADTFRKFIEGLPGIKSKLAMSFKKGKGMVDFTDDERILLDLANNIKSEIIGSHPTLGGLNDFYREGKNNINLFRKYILGPDIRATQSNIRKFNHAQDFDVVRTASQAILDKKTLKNVMDYSDADNFSQLLKQIQQRAITEALPITVGAGAVGAYVANKINK